MSQTMDVTNRVQQIFRDLFDDENITIFREMTAKDIAEWDSLNHVTLIVSIEKEFNIKFTLAEIQSFANVGQLLDLTEQKISSRG